MVMGAQGQGGKRAREGGSTGGAEAGNSVHTAQWDGEAVGCVAGTAVWVRADLASTGRGEAVWRAGRRSGRMRLRDVRLGDGGANTLCGRSDSDGKRRRFSLPFEGGENSVLANPSMNSEWEYMLDEVMEDAERGRRRYVVGARWHEGAIVLCARQMGNPALLWRYGDG